MGCAQELAQHAPYTSKDIDFCGSQDMGRTCAEALGGEFRTPSALDHAPVNAGVVAYRDTHSVERKIDFLYSAFGIDAAELAEMSVPFGRPVVLRVMHPVHCLESRAHNVASLPGYDTEHARKQLRAAIICAREFLRESLSDNVRPRVVLRHNERIFRFSLRKAGRSVFVKHSIDTFKAVCVHDRLPVPFRTVRYPQMQQHLAKKRGDWHAIHQTGTVTLEDAC